MIAARKISLCSAKLSRTLLGHILKYLQFYRAGAVVLGVCKCFDVPDIEERTVN